MQFTTNIKDRHKGGQFEWVFDNIHQIINDKVGEENRRLSTSDRLKDCRFFTKKHFKLAYSRLRSAKKVLNQNHIYITVVSEPFKLL